MGWENHPRRKRKGFSVISATLRNWRKLKPTSKDLGGHESPGGEGQVLADHFHKSRGICQLLLLVMPLSVLPAMVPHAKAATASVGNMPHQRCARCHLPTGDLAAGLKPGKPPQQRPCIECHGDVSRQAEGHLSAAGNVESGHASSFGLGGQKIAPLGGKSYERLECVSCHVPHFKGERNLLRLDRETVKPGTSGAAFDPATQLCLSCHPIAAEFKGFGRGYVRHPVGIPVAKAGRVLDRSQLPPLFDVRGTEDPSDDIIGCTTCHFPHASKNPFLLRWNGPVGLSAACLKCHPDVAPSGAGNVNVFWGRR